MYGQKNEYQSINIELNMNSFSVNLLYMTYDKKETLVSCCLVSFYTFIISF